MLKFLQTHKFSILILALLAGTFIRVILPFHGHNFDVESYQIASQIMQNGGNVYAETARYNYGPVWFLIIAALTPLAKVITTLGIHELVALHISIAAFLTLADIGIFYVLLKKFGAKASLLFFLNPISIIITGYHSQFDNLAIFVGLLAIISLEEDLNTASRTKKIKGLILLGFSLIIKHIAFIFPIWLAFKQKGLMAKILVILIPFGIFALSFLPFWSEGSTGIIQNVFLYRSQPNSPFWYSFLPGIVYNNVPMFALFLGGLTLLGLVVRKWANLNSFMVYLCALVVFSSAISNQYLAIPIAYIATNFNFIFGIYSLWGLLYLLINPAGLTLDWLGRLIPSRLASLNILVILLTLGLTWNLYRQKLTQGGKFLKGKLLEELKFQLFSRGSF